MSGSPREAGSERLWNISAAVDAAVRAFVDRQPVSEFYDLVRYHLGWQGDGQQGLWPRSVLCVLACEACGGSFDQAVPMAVAIALLHGFELNEEDLERQRLTRQGRRTVWGVWGRPQAMNAGDGMHALAKMALLAGRSQLSPGDILHLEKALDECSLRTCEAIYVEQAAGQQAARPEPIDGRAAVSYGCAAATGCWLADGGNSPHAACLERFGELLGRAVDARSASPAEVNTLREQALKALEASGVAAAHCSALRHLVEYVLTSED